MSLAPQTAPLALEGIPPPSPEAAWWRRVEAPTWALSFAVYGGFALVTWFYDALPAWSVLPLGAWFVCWHGSLQHEALHGHPTRRRWLDTLIAFPPLWLWLPYRLYRESHLAHHEDALLTTPGVDPESFYVTGAAWARMGPLVRAVLRFRNTLAGRLLIGPAVAYWELARGELALLRAGDTRHVVDWIVHVPACAAVLYWALAVCGIPLWVYVLCFAYPGLSLTMLRSYAEHRPAEDPAWRTATVEAGPVMRLLFLNNNYHVAHHALPGLAWYEIGPWHRANRAAMIERNGGYLFSGYAEQVRRFLLTPKDEPIHPTAA